MEGEINQHLPSYYNIQKNTNRFVSADRTQKQLLEVRVPSDYTKGHDPHLDFYYSDLIEVACALLSNPLLVRSEEDILWTQAETFTSPEHVHNSNLNTGHWYKRTEDWLLGYPNLSGKTLLPIMIFLDDTNLVTRGTQTAKPILVTLGCFSEAIRNKAVSIIDS